MHVHGRAGKPKQLARNAKNPGKTRVLQHGLQKTSGEDRNRTTSEIPGYSQCSSSRDADSGAPFETLGNLNTSTVDPIDSDLATIMHSWPALDTAVKKSILEMISRCL